MDVSKLTDDMKAHYCKKYTIIGAFFLPFVWITSLFCFTPFALKGTPSPSRSSVRLYLILSLIGLLVWISIIAGWEATFQYYRAAQSIWTENWAFQLPIGKF